MQIGFKYGTYRGILEMDKRRITTVVLTLAVAFGTGYLMQNGSSMAARLNGTSPKAPSPASTPAADLIDDAKAALPDMPADALTPNLGANSRYMHDRRQAALDGGLPAPQLSDPQTPAPFLMTDDAI